MLNGGTLKSVALTLISQKKLGDGAEASQTPAVPVVNPSVAAAWAGPEVLAERSGELGWLRPVAVL